MPPAIVGSVVAKQAEWWRHTLWLARQHQTMRQHRVASHGVAHRSPKGDRDVACTTPRPVIPPVPPPLATSAEAASLSSRRPQSARGTSAARSGRGAAEPLDVSLAPFASAPVDARQPSRASLDTEERRVTRERAETLVQRHVDNQCRYWQPLLRCPAIHAAAPPPPAFVSRSDVADVARQLQGALDCVVVCERQHDQNGGMQLDDDDALRKPGIMADYDRRFLAAVVQYEADLLLWHTSCHDPSPVHAAVGAPEALFAYLQRRECLPVSDGGKALLLAASVQARLKAAGPLSAALSVGGATTSTRYLLVNGRSTASAIRAVEAANDIGCHCLRLASPAASSSSSDTVRLLLLATSAAPRCWSADFLAFHAIHVAERLLALTLRPVAAVLLRHDTSLRMALTRVRVAAALSNEERSHDHHHHAALLSRSAPHRVATALADLERAITAVVDDAALLRPEDHYRSSLGTCLGAASGEGDTTSPSTSVVSIDGGATTAAVCGPNIDDGGDAMAAILRRCTNRMAKAAAAVDVGSSDAQRRRRAPLLPSSSIAPTQRDSAAWPSVEEEGDGRPISACPLVAALWAQRRLSKQWMSQLAEEGTSAAASTETLLTRLGDMWLGSSSSERREEGEGAHQGRGGDVSADTLAFACPESIVAAAATRRM